MKFIEILTLLLMISIGLSPMAMAQSKSDVIKFATKQGASNAEATALVNKYKVNPSTFYKNLEKEVSSFAKSNLSNFKVTKVNINRKSGKISLVGKNSAGKVETLTNLRTNNYYEDQEEEEEEYDGFFDWLVRGVIFGGKF